MEVGRESVIERTKRSNLKGKAPGQLHQLGQYHVRLPESGRGAPCGLPSQGITPVTVQIVVRYRNFHTSLATGCRFLGRKKKTIGRGAPCGRPSSAIVASELRCVCPGKAPKSDARSRCGMWRFLIWWGERQAGRHCEHRTRQKNRDKIPNRSMITIWIANNPIDK